MALQYLLASEPRCTPLRAETQLRLHLAAEQQCFRPGKKLEGDSVEGFPTTSDCRNDSAC